MEDSRKLPDAAATRLCSLAHDLSNAIETILHAAYLLGQAKLDPEGEKWRKMIDRASRDAARINHEIRQILRSQA